MESGRIEFFVPGRPRPKGSYKPISVKGRTVLIPNSKTSKPWALKVAAIARTVFTGPSLKKPTPISMHCEFIFARPKNHFRTRGGKIDRTLIKPNVSEFPMSKNAYPDTDKLLRNVFDALSNVVYEDDSQIVDVKSSKRFHEEEDGVFIVITWGKGRDV